MNIIIESQTPVEVPKPTEETVYVALCKAAPGGTYWYSLADTSIDGLRVRLTKHYPQASEVRIFTVKVPYHGQA